MIQELLSVTAASHRRQVLVSMLPIASRPRAKQNGLYICDTLGCLKINGKFLPRMPK